MAPAAHGTRLAAQNRVALKSRGLAESAVTWEARDARRRRFDPAEGARAAGARAVFHGVLWLSAARLPRDAAEHRASWELPSGALAASLALGARPVRVVPVPRQEAPEQLASGRLA